MNLKLITDYYDLCLRYHKPMTWEGLKLFKASLK